MAVHLPESPYDLGTNSVYQQLQDDHRRKIDFWLASELKHKHDAISLKRLLKHTDLFVIDARGEGISPSFKIMSTAANIILRHVSLEKRSFTELRGMMPSGAQAQGRLKHLLSFLWNFEQIQCFSPPASGRTYIALDGFSEVEDEIDEIFHIVDGLEDRFKYQIPVFAPDPASYIHW